MFEELLLRDVGGISTLMLDEIGGKKLDEPKKVYEFNPSESRQGGAIENFLFKLRESNPDIYGEYSRPRLEKDRGYRDKPQEGLFMARGGRIGYAMGDTAEDNAMQASGIMGLPLNENPAGVTELDLRNTGGFIPPVGVKEKADDIPAMLSNNEFVFTADAVRGMGDGDVNKGAERMYSMMKQLENGGRV